MGDNVYCLLDNLGETDFRRFKALLKNPTLSGFAPIPWGRLEKADVTETVRLMTERYGIKDCMVITQHILEAMGHKVLPQDLSSGNTNLTVSGAGTGGVSEADAAAFVDRQRNKLIARVHNVMPIADELLSKELVRSEKYSEISAAATSQAKMRVIYECLNAAGAEGKAAFYGILLQEEPHLVKDLNKPAS